jgi:hypothetical protein
MRRGAPQPGDLLLDPVILLALAVLVLNDQVLKGPGPAPLTGIMSGMAGLVLMPSVLVAGIELLARLRGAWLAPSMRLMLAASLAVGSAYALVELLPAATDLYGWTWGMLQWPGATALALLGGHPLPGIVPVRAIADPFDLLALPCLAIPVLLQARRLSAASSTVSAA